MHIFYLMLHLMFFLSLPVPSQSAVVTTTGNGNASCDALNFSVLSNVSNISYVIAPEILNQEIQGEIDEFKDLVSEELKNLKIAEEQEKKKQQEKIRKVAQEKALLLWHKKRKKKKLMLKLNVKDKNNKKSKLSRNVKKNYHLLINVNSIRKN